jgi:predicted NAD/FAD-binding protein
VAHDLDGRELPLDTGFIVYNEKTYPNLTRVFAELEVDTQASDMSFSVSSRDPDVEYASHSLPGLFAQPSLLLSATHLRMLIDVVRFGRRGRRLLAGSGDPDATIADFLHDGKFSDAFATYFLFPMTAAIWSSGTELVTGFPRDPLLRFLDNHGLLQVTGQPEWRTVVGGSSSYIAPMVREFKDRVHLGCGVDRIVRSPGDVEIRLEDGSRHLFDHVVVAAHADQALKMLADPTQDERALLGGWTYSINDTWLHTDTTLMPRRRGAWASWNYLMTDGSSPQDRASVSYHLNRLQGLEEDLEYMVTLNPEREIVSRASRKTSSTWSRSTRSANRPPNRSFGGWIMLTPSTTQTALPRRQTCRASTATTELTSAAPTLPTDFTRTGSILRLPWRMTSAWSSDATFGALRGFGAASPIWRALTWI